MNPCRILCVHQGPELDELRHQLESDGYEVFPAADGGKAMDLLSSQPVDGVILDSDLSAPDGCTLRNRILHALPDMPLLLFREVSEVKHLPLKVFRAYLDDPDAPDAVLAHLKN